MKVKEYLIDKLTAFLLLFLMIFFVIFILYLADVKKQVILIIITIIVIWILIVCIMDFIKRRSYYNYLLSIIENLNEKSLISDIVKEPNFYDAMIFFEILRSSNKYMNDQISRYQIESKEYRDYIEMWVHEVKTPITAIQLYIENNKNLTTLCIREELKKIESFVEQTLYYARSNSVEKDFKIQAHSLKEITLNVIKRYSSTIIQQKGNIHLDNLDYEILVDDKWVEFILSQIIMNSIKYCGEQLELYFFSIEFQDKVDLHIKDKGIGINSKDINQIFEKGFTGENGHQYKKSTGMGLYLCKKLCSKMNLGITVKSTLGIGTEIIVSFPKKQFL